MKRIFIRIVWLTVLLLATASPQKLFAHGGQIEAGGAGGGPVTLTKLQQESIGLQTDKADFHSIDTILLLNGSADKTVPFGQTESFFKALKAADVDATLIAIPEGQHRIADWKKFMPDWQQQLVDWLGEKLVVK